MNRHSWIITGAIIAVFAMAIPAGVTGALFNDTENSTGNSLQGWTSNPWNQTTQADFQAGVLNNADASSSPGDVKLDAVSNNVTDPLNGESMVASKSNVIVTGGQAKLTGAYDTLGTLTSTNLLSGQSVASINSFGYNASAIPSGTTLQVQFSQNGSAWYSSAGTVGGLDTLSQGTNSISLSGLGWAGPNFYYKMQFTSDGTDTPVLEEISVNYYSYCASATAASQVLDTGVIGARWDALFWNETLQGNTDISFEIRASDTAFSKDATTPSWTSVGGTSPVTSELPAGRYKQWRASMTTSDTSLTPTLHEVRVYYY